MPQVVTCVLVHHEKILVLKRSSSVRTYKGMWGGVAGYIEPGEKPLQTAMKEIQEEVGLRPDDVQLLVTGDVLTFTDTSEGERYDWVVHPFLFRLKHERPVRIDWEHSEYRWVDPQELSNLPTVPHFPDTVTALLRKGGWGRVEMR